VLWICDHCDPVTAIHRVEGPTAVRAPLDPDRQRTPVPVALPLAAPISASSTSTSDPRACGSTARLRAPAASTRHSSAG